MTARPVHWNEGVHLKPHHLQADRRYVAHLVRTGERWDHPYGWGLREVDLDLDALANHRLVVRSLKARLRDGTLVAAPEEGALPAVDLRPALAGAASVTAYVGVPLVQSGRANVAHDGRAEEARHLLLTQEVEDENTGLNPQPVDFHRLNVRLLLSTQDHAGYEVLPVARAEKSPDPEAAPRLDPTYVPPVLACDAWPPLAGMLQTAGDRVGKKLDLVAGQVVGRGISFDGGAPGDGRLIRQAEVLNIAHASLRHLAFARGVHPAEAYGELCRLAGHFGIFDEATRRAPDLPVYDHDDLGGCFFRVKRYLDLILDGFAEPEYQERPFVGAGLRMQVALEPAWLEPIWQMFIGVRSPLAPEECARLLIGPGQLDMKVGSSDRADELYRLGERGLEFRPTRPPRALPQRPDLTYFQVDRGSEQREWDRVRQSLTLAVRLNEDLIRGDVQGQRVLTVSDRGRNTTMQFTLYVVPGDATSRAARGGP